MPRLLFLISVLICVLGQSIISAAQSVKTHLAMKNSERKARFISFDTNSGKVDINLDLSVPFLSFPLEDNSKQNGEASTALVNINVKALIVFAVLMAISTFVVPLFVNKVQDVPLHPSEEYHIYGKEHKRTDRGLNFGYLGDSLNEILFRNSRVTPCLQRIVCSTIAAAHLHAENPTSVDKIIDALSSYKWLEQTANGTVIEEAVMKGHQVANYEECISLYKGCALEQDFIPNILKIIGI